MKKKVLRIREQPTRCNIRARAPSAPNMAEFSVSTECGKQGDPMSDIYCTSSLARLWPSYKEREREEEEEKARARRKEGRKEGRASWQRTILCSSAAADRHSSPYKYSRLAFAGEEGGRDCILALHFRGGGSARQRRYLHLVPREPWPVSPQISSSRACTR